MKLHQLIIKLLFPVLVGTIYLMGLWSCSPEPQPLKIAIMGDQTGSYDLDSSYAIMAQAAHQMQRHSPDLLVHVGDITESQVADPDEYQRDFERARSIMASVGIPWYLTAGDHDVNPAGFMPGSNDRSNETRFKDLCSQAGLPIGDKLYYSIDFKDYHLVFLYSLEVLHSDPRWGSIFLNQISEKQLDWLRADLENSKSADGVVVIVHHPHWYSWSNWYRVHAVLREYPVVAVIAGHYHYDQDDGVIDGINYLVVGATGGAIKQADAESGGCQQYGLLTIAGDSIMEYELREVFSDTVLERTSRRSMDRIQALSTTISNVYGDEHLVSYGQKLFSVGSKDQDSTVLTIESIANPIDVPVEVSIQPLGQILNAPRWVGNWSRTGENGIILPPGTRCGWANYASSGHWFTQPVIWEADLLAKKNGADKTIGVDIKMSFTDSRPRWISGKVMFPVHGEKELIE